MPTLHPELFFNHEIKREFPSLYSLMSIENYFF